MWTNTASALVAASLLATSASAAGLYPKGSAVVNVDAGSYKRLIADSNYTSIVEFYAPWCGHCQNLKPAYEKAAKNLQGLAKVAAVNCDDEENKPLCGQMGIKGFPTLKVMRPGKKPGKPIIEDYQMQRTAKAIVDHVVERIPNHVKKLSDKNFNDFLSEKNETAKAILFTEKGTTSALIRALAIDYLGSISFAQAKNGLSAVKDTFGITTFPTLVLLPGGDKESIVYNGDMKKETMSKFLEQVASPNPDPAPVEPKAKKDSKKDAKKDKKASSAFSKASKSHKASDAASEKLKPTSVSLEDQGQPTESPSPEVDHEKPIDLEEKGTYIKSLTMPHMLNEVCFEQKSGICILAILPATDESGLLPEADGKTMTALGEVHSKLSKRHKLFPFYAVPIFNAKAAEIRKALSLKGEDSFELVAVNAKRGWYRRYSGSSYSKTALEQWVDDIRMNEGKKETLPSSLIVGASSSTGSQKQKQQMPIQDSTASIELDNSEFVMQDGSMPDPVQPAEPEASPEPAATADPVVEHNEAAEPEPVEMPQPGDVHDEL